MNEKFKYYFVLATISIKVMVNYIMESGEKEDGKNISRDKIRIYIE